MIISEFLIAHEAGIQMAYRKNILTDILLSSNSLLSFFHAHCFKFDAAELPGRPGAPIAPGSPRAPCCPGAPCWPGIPGFPEVPGFPGVP